MSFLELFITDSPYNDVYYSNPEYDALLAEANTLTGDERLAKMEEAEKMRGGAEKLLVRSDELLRIYRILLKIGGKLIEFYSRFEYNGE